MKLLIDDINIERIKKLWLDLPCDGVTTNPTILSKYSGDLKQHFCTIRNIIGEKSEFHVQVISTEAENMVEEARHIAKQIVGNVYVKIPVTREGIIAIKILKQEGIQVTGTGVYTMNQAFFAAKAGADYIAPYVNRIDNLGQDGIDTVLHMQDIIDTHQFSTKILAASFKNAKQVLDLIAGGIEAVTVAPDVLNKMVENALADDAVTHFVSDFSRTYGTDKTMLNLI